MKAKETKQKKQTPKVLKVTRGQSLFDPAFKYVPSTATDVTQTWRKHGWTPIEESGKAYKEAP